MTQKTIRHPTGEQLLKLDFRSDPSMLCVVRGAIERLTEVTGFSAADSRSITRAVDEAITNIMRHSYKNHPGKEIVLQVLRLKPSARPDRGDGLVFLLCDRGPAVDPAKMQGRPLDEIKPGGLGLHFIRQSMDIVEFKRARGGNLLRLVKYLQPAAQPEAGKRREALADLGPKNR
jgi:anti-sigma regulatory factor (Ser/Thr protein kinase)